MKLFLVSQAREAVPQIFKDFGLNKSTPAKPSDIQVLSLSRPTLQYSINVAAMNAHAIAELGNTHAFSDNFTYVLNKVPVSRTFECPPLRFVFGDLSSGERDTLVQLGMNAETGNIYTGQVPITAVTTINKMKPLSGTYRAGTVDWDGYVAWAIMMRFLTFISFASYGFGSPVTILSQDPVVHATPTTTVKMSNTGPIMGELKDFVVPAGTNAYKFSSMVSGVTGSNRIRAFSFVELNAITKGQLGLFSIVLPFFGQMMIPDAAFTFTTFVSLFGTLIGFTDSSEKLLAMIKRGIYTMAFCEAGKAIGHAVMVSQMAIQAGQTVRFVVHRGVYHGAIISGATEFSFLVGGIKYTAEGIDRTMEDILSLDQHTQALNLIVEELTGQIDDGVVITVTTEQIKTSRLLYDFLRKHLAFILANKEIKENMEKHIELLRYMDKYAEPSQANIVLFLDYLISGDENLLSSQPAFLKNGRWMKTSRIDHGLSMFGPMAPTINWGIDRKASEQKNFPLTLKAADLFTATPTKPAMYLPYKLIAVGGASTHWQTLFKNGTLSLTAGRKDKKEIFNLTGTKANITGLYATSIWEKCAQIYTLEKEGKKRTSKDSEGPVTGAKKKRVEVPVELDDML